MSFLKTNKVSKMSATERNAWYNSLTKQQKAVAICEDVLLQIKSQKYVMESGVYLGIKIADNTTDRTVKTIANKEKLEDMVAAKSVTCAVCAMGSAFMSAVRLGNNCNTKQLFYLDEDGINDISAGDYLDIGTSDAPGFTDKLEEAFTVKEYRAMEFMFENDDVDHTFRGTQDYNTLDNYNTEHYYKLNQEDKMIKMCKQIIKDDGYFLIPDVDLENLNK